MKINDEIYMCNCLLDGDQKHIVPSNDRETCNYCGYYIINKLATKIDLKRVRRQKKKLIKALDGLEGSIYETI